MAGLAIAGAKRTELKSDIFSVKMAVEVLAGGAVARFAADIGESFQAERAAVSALLAEAYCVATDAVWIRVSADFDEGFESVSVSGFLPDSVGFGVALFARGGTDIGCAAGDAGNGIRIVRVGIIEARGVLRISER